MIHLVLGGARSGKSRFAEKIALITPYKTLSFYGGMGVGKTTLIKALAKQIGVTDELTSPTFSIVNEYEMENDTRTLDFPLMVAPSIAIFDSPGNITMKPSSSFIATRSIGMAYLLNIVDSSQGRNIANAKCRERKDACT